jgi:hypothetical protein
MAISERWLTCYAKWSNRKDKDPLNPIADVICQLIEELSLAEEQLAEQKEQFDRFAAVSFATVAERDRTIEKLNAELKIASKEI